MMFKTPVIYDQKRSLTIPHQNLINIIPLAYKTRPHTLLSQSIAVYRSLSQSSTVHHSISQPITVHHRLSQPITVHHSPSQTIAVYHSISQEQGARREYRIGIRWRKHPENQLGKWSTLGKGNKSTGKRAVVAYSCLS